EQQVEEVRRAVERQRRRAESHKVFIDTMVRLLTMESETRADVLADALRDDLFRQYISLLADYAAKGQDMPNTGDASTLLDEVAAATSAMLPGSGSDRAFQLLVAIGHWSPDHNVLLRRYRVPARFSTSVEAAAMALAEQTPDAMTEPNRVDLTSTLMVTIDDPETLDIGDALSVEPLPTGHFRLGIHIADPTALVPWDSKLEKQARRRGTSIYLPDRVVPMFPEVLSEDLFSLVAGEPRRALSFIIELDATMEVISEEIVLSTVCI